MTPAPLADVLTEMQCRCTINEVLSIGLGPLPSPTRPEPQNRRSEAVTTMLPDTSVSGRWARCLRRCVWPPETGARHSRPLMSGSQMACLDGCPSQVAITLCKWQ